MFKICNMARSTAQTPSRKMYVMSLRPDKIQNKPCTSVQSICFMHFRYTEKSGKIWLVIWKSGIWKSVIWKSGIWKSGKLVWKDWARKSAPSQCCKWTWQSCDCWSRPWLDSQFVLVATPTCFTICWQPFYFCSTSRMFWEDLPAQLKEINLRFCEIVRYAIPFFSEATFEIGLFLHGVSP